MCWKEGWSRAGRPEEVHGGNISDWMLLKKMEIKEREKNEVVSSRAKAKSRKVTSTRAGAGGAVSALGAVQGARVCSTQNST